MYKCLNEHLESIHQFQLDLRKKGVRTFNEASKEDQQEEGICHQGLSVKSAVKRMSTARSPGIQMSTVHQRSALSEQSSCSVGFLYALFF